jgi:hypothetical protein
MLHRFFLVNIPFSEKRCVLMALSAGQVKSELAGLRQGVFGGPYAMSTMAIRAGRSRHVAPIVPNPVNAPVVQLVFLLVTIGTEKVQWFAFIVRPRQEGFGTPVALAAGDIRMDGFLEFFAPNEEVQLFASRGDRLDVFVPVARQAGCIIDIQLRLGSGFLREGRAGHGSQRCQEQEKQDVAQSRPFVARRTWASVALH